jgi:hypothetical protein
MVMTVETRENYSEHSIKLPTGHYTVCILACWIKISEDIYQAVASDKSCHVHVNEEMECIYGTVKNTQACKNMKNINNNLKHRTRSHKC